DSYVCFCLTPPTDCPASSRRRNIIYKRGITGVTCGGGGVSSWISDMENYEVLERLGSGGSAEVRRCRSLRSGKFFAMKRFFAPDETHLIFQRELAPLSVLKHDNVIRLLTAFLHGGIMHAIFELLEHSLLDELKIKGCGLENFIHSRNIMHLDIKPDNLLVSCSGVLKLADFGSSRASNHAAEPLTRDAGAMLFSAPEMLLMDPDYNKPVDVWAVGCTLVFMATGNYFLNGRSQTETHMRVSLHSQPPWGMVEASAQQLHVLLATKHHSASARERQGRGRKGKHNESVHTDAEARRNTTSLSKRLHDYCCEQYYQPMHYLSLFFVPDGSMFPSPVRVLYFVNLNNSTQFWQRPLAGSVRERRFTTKVTTTVTSWISDMENYIVLEPLGSGGFGEVLKCRSLRSGNFFAMKRFFAPDETHHIFQRELAPLSVLKHDNVIRLLTAFLHGGLMHAIFELLEHSLCDELKKKGCGLESLTIKKYSFQILRAVDFIHSHNIMHRDIKPDNLLVSRSGVLKLADFGSGRASNHAAVPLTRAAGTMWFSAPEMLVMDPDYNKPVDVWAVGCTLVFMTTGNYFLKGERFLEHIKMIITKVGPLTAIQEQQYLNNVKHAREFAALPLVSVGMSLSLESSHQTLIGLIWTSSRHFVTGSLFLRNMCSTLGGTIFHRISRL
uniref:Protein kinase domain-containing protein n=1 Tax=Gadus morhua TaxID=8049 RepID=A0A8C5C892_GADMO